MHKSIKRRNPSETNFSFHENLKSRLQTKNFFFSHWRSRWLLGFVNWKRPITKRHSEKKKFFFFFTFFRSISREDFYFANLATVQKSSHARTCFIFCLLRPFDNRFYLFDTFPNSSIYVLEFWKLFSCEILLGCVVVTETPRDDDKSFHFFFLLSPPAFFSFSFQPLKKNSCSKDNGFIAFNVAACKLTKPLYKNGFKVARLISNFYLFHQLLKFNAHHKSIIIISNCRANIYDSSYKINIPTQTHTQFIYLTSRHSHTSTTNWIAI